MCGQTKEQTAQIPGNEPFTRLPATSWGEEVSSPRVGTTLRDYPQCSALAIPTLRFSILCLVCSFRFRELIAIRVRHSSFSRGHPSGNARGGKCMCLTHPPVRARNRRGQKETADSLDSGIRNSFSSFTVLFYSSFFLQLRQIASCSCIRDMKKLFYFVVCDFRLF